MQRHNPFVRLQCMGGAYRNGFLTNATEPLTNFSLAQEYQHFFLNHPGQEQLPVQMNKGFVVILIAVKLHGKDSSTNLQVVCFRNRIIYSTKKPP